MEFRNLVTFQKICSLGSFSKAATELGYSQSTVTMQIQQLEKELGVKLFDRIGKTVTVTGEGMRFLTYATSIITTCKNAMADLSSMDQPRGELRIGVLESICTAHLPKLLREYHLTYPQVSTVIRTGTFSELASLLNSDQIDLLWTFDDPIDMADWVKAITYYNPISILCSSKHPLAQMSSLTLKDIAPETFLLTEKNCSYRKHFESRLLQLGFQPTIFLEIGNTEVIKKFVEAGLGLAVLPHYTVEDELALGKLTCLNLTDYQPLMQGQIFYHKSKWVSPAIKTFITAASELSE